MEKLLPPDAAWEAVLASGREDLNSAIELVGMSTGKELTVLDVGCGIGRITQNLAEHFGRVVGVDIAETMLERARQYNANPAIEFELCDGLRLAPQCCRKFDAVFSYEVLYYIDPQVLKN